MPRGIGKPHTEGLEHPLDDVNVRSAQAGRGDLHDDVVRPAKARIIDHLEPERLSVAVQACGLHL